MGKVKDTEMYRTGLWADEVMVLHWEHSYPDEPLLRALAHLESRRHPSGTCISLRCVNQSTQDVVEEFDTYALRASAEFSLHMTLDDNAYRTVQDDNLLELPQIAADVKEVADRIFNGDTKGRVKDSNGNTCGKWTITNPREGVGGE